MKGYMTINKKQRDRFRRIRKSRFNKLFNRYISKIGCADCKIKGPKEIFQFDHHPGVRKSSDGGLRTILVHSLKTIFNKIRNDGQFVCANCHAIRTHSRGQYIGRPIK